MILVHHLGVSQSERVVWLLEELGLPYSVKLYARDRQTGLAPPELGAVNPLGSAPVIEDGDVRLAESGAILDYIVSRHGDGRLRPPPDAKTFPDFLYWFHYANASLMPAITGNLVVDRATAGEPAPIARMLRHRLQRHLDFVEARIAQVPCFAGEDFTCADIMMLFPLSKMLGFYPVDMSARPAVAAWRERVEARPAFKRAMAACGEAPAVAA